VDDQKQMFGLFWTLSNFTAALDAKGCVHVCLACVSPQQHLHSVTLALQVAHQRGGCGVSYMLAGLPSRRWAHPARSGRAASSTASQQTRTRCTSWSHPLASRCAAQHSSISSSTTMGSCSGASQLHHQWVWRPDTNTYMSRPRLFSPPRMQTVTTCHTRTRVSALQLA
jgi:hypothetical protein